MLPMTANSCQRGVGPQRRKTPVGVARAAGRDVAGSARGGAREAAWRPAGMKKPKPGRVRGDDRGRSARSGSDRGTDAISWKAVQQQRGGSIIRSGFTCGRRSAVDSDGAVRHHYGGGWFVGCRSGSSSFRKHKTYRSDNRFQRMVRATGLCVSRTIVTRPRARTSSRPLVYTQVGQTMVARTVEGIIFEETKLARLIEKSASSGSYPRTILWRTGTAAVILNEIIRRAFRWTRPIGQFSIDLRVDSSARERRESLLKKTRLFFHPPGSSGVAGGSELAGGVVRESDRLGDAALTSQPSCWS
jgi:hypothetical protein